VRVRTSAWWTCRSAWVRRFSPFETAKPACAQAFFGRYGANSDLGQRSTSGTREHSDHQHRVDRRADQLGPKGLEPYGGREKP
jgi:hypothetical protein